MVVAGRQKSIAFFIALGAGVITVTVLFYVGWVMLNWKHSIVVGLGALLVLLIVAGVVVNTIFLVREIRVNAQHDAFINAVTHELKTPVASIRLYLQTLQTRPVDDTKRAEFYRTMLADSDRLLDTIEQVLRAGRARGASHRPNLTRVEVRAIVEDCLHRARTAHHLADGALTYRGGGDATILADPDDVRSAVSNLIDNAVKYSHKPVQVTVESETVEGRFVRVRVSDQGVGIPKMELKRVFKRFYRVPGPLAARVKGTGLGLFIVRSVAKRHGGRVWAESDGPGRGSTFVLQLPIAP